MKTIILAGTSSCVGKTVTAMGILLACRASGLTVCAAKVGPDFIDTGYLQAVTGTPCANLDLWMQGRNGVMRLLRRIAEADPDILVIEGAMGLYDGGEGSAAELAAVFGFPVVLLLGAKGLGESIAAVAKGFLSLRDDVPFAGLIASHVGSARHARLVRDSLRPVCRDFAVPFLGCLSREGAPSLPSRHLGLVGVEESGVDFEALRLWFERGCTFAPLLPERKRSRKQDSGGIFFRLESGLGDCMIALAYDEAFSFCYADLPALFGELGFRVTFFSPLHDREIPFCHGIVLPGGYPECHARALSENGAMRASFACACARDVPIYAECGGMIALLSAYSVDGVRYPMFGVLPGQATLTSSCVALGYREATATWPEPVCVRGHEFHYATLDADALSCQPLWQVADRDGVALGPSGLLSGRIAASWLHLSPEGGRPFFAAWTAYIRECVRDRA